MRKTLVILASAAGLLVLIGAVLAWLGIPEQMALGSAFKARALAAGIFVQGIDQKTLEAEDAGFNGAFKVMWATVDQKRRAVTVSPFGLGLLGATAVAIPGGGAVVLSGRTEEQVRQLAVPAHPWQPGTRDPRPWPLGDQASVTPDPRIDAAVQVAFDEPDPQNLKRTRAVLVLVDGRLAAERYGPGITADTRLLSWSMAKTFTNALVGIAVGRGQLDLHKPVLRGITTDDLLRMVSGLSFAEDYSEKGITDATRMLFFEPDFAAFTAAQPSVAAPGTLWNYSSGSANLAQRALRTALGDDAYWRFPEEQLFGPLGLRSAEFGIDPSGTFVGSSYLYATARDYARFGQFLLQDGVWAGRRILPEGWVRDSVTPTPAAPQGQYGSSIWLNAGTPGNPEDRPYPDLPADLFYADGHNGQSIYVFPSWKAVVVRLGMSWQPDWGAAEFLSAVKKALGH